jgi:hypothetical protein
LAYFGRLLRSIESRPSAEVLGVVAVAEPTGRVVTSGGRGRCGIDMPTRMWSLARQSRGPAPAREKLTTAMTTKAGETPLGELLRLAEWSARQLVTAIKARLSGQGRGRLRLDPTAGYSWVRRGFRPRLPIPGR